MFHNWLILNNFCLQAGLAGLGISIIAGPLGAIMLWRNMAYFGDTLAHSALLGVVLAVMFKVNIYFGLLGICLLVAILLFTITSRQQLTNDAILNILSNSILAIGLLIASKLEYIRLDLLGYFYGDILAINLTDIYYIMATVIIVLLMLWYLWRRLLLITLHEDLAKVAGIAVARVKLIFVLLMALVFAVTIKLFGMLLLVALLVIPVASARKLATTPEMMALLGSIFSAIAVILGLMLSLAYDLPTGPAIVVVATLNFLLFYLGKKTCY